MGCLLVIIAMLLPRLLMFFIWLLTDWFGKSFDTVIWPVLGFVFLPYTTLAYLAAMLNNNHSVSGWWTVLLVVAVLVDLGHLCSSGDKAARRRCVCRG